MFCRLCCEASFPSQNLYDQYGKETFVLKICKKFFNQVIENLEKTLKTNSEKICDSCWKSIYEFNEFHEKIIRQHTVYCNSIIASKSMVLEDSSDGFKTETEAVQKSPINVSEDDLSHKDPFLIKAEGSEDSKVDGLDFQSGIQKTETFQVKTEILKEDSGSFDLDDIKIVDQSYYWDGGPREMIEKNENQASTSNSFGNHRLAMKYGKVKKQEKRLFMDIGASESQDKEPNTDEINWESLLSKEKWNPTLSCDLCDFTSKQYAKFMNHYLIEHQGNKDRGKMEKPYDCAICQRPYSTKQTLKTHIFNHVDNKAFDCYYCEKRIKSGKLFDKHMRIEHKKFRHDCDQCEGSFTSFGAFKHHYLHEHLGETRTKFFCNLCGIELATKQGLTKHLERRVCIAGSRKRIKRFVPADTSEESSFDASDSLYNFRGKWTCHKCGANLSSKQSFQYHTDNKVCEINRRSLRTKLKTVTSTETKEDVKFHNPE